MITNTNNQPDFLNSKTWNEVNRNLMAKSLSELMHEQVALPEIVKTEEDGLTHFRLDTDHAAIYYTFSAYKRMLDYWHIVKESIQKHENDKVSDVLDVPKFFIELQQKFTITSFTLAHYVEELLNTLYADAFIKSKGRLSASALADADYQTIEHQMDGHPWVIVNKSRLGFDGNDYKKYAPEADKNNSMLWIAAHTSRATFRSSENIKQDEFYLDEIGKDKVAEFNKVLTDKKLNPKEYVFMPVHQWQWDNKLEMQFASDIAQGFLVLLGKGTDIYSPQQSIRTFFNVNNPHKHYVKTALSILSTGNIRGLSPKQMAIAPQITQWVQGALKEDAYLQATGVELIGEVATVAYLHPHYNAINSIPYQYNEMLGALWRESAANCLKPGEKMITMASLLYIDDDNNSFLEELIQRSGLTHAQWLKAYLNAYLKPLLHMDYRHSICVTPHGENIILVMKNNVPERIIIKDFVDDIVLTKEAMEKLPKEVTEGMIKPSNNKEGVPLFILIGVFDAFFRYMSDVMQTYSGFNEKEFWYLVNDLVVEYQEQNPDLQAKFERYNLYVPEFKRFYINSLRLQNGYEERTGFAIPQKGGKLENPLALIRQNSLV